jgi:hypothetical protein
MEMTGKSKKAYRFLRPKVNSKSGVTLKVFYPKGRLAAGELFPKGMRRGTIQEIMNEK